MPHEGNADPVTNDVPRFHSNMPISELTERDTRAIKASVISSTPTKPNGAWGLEPPDRNSGIQLTGVQRLAREGLEVASHQTEPREKM